MLQRLSLPTRYPIDPDDLASLADAALAEPAGAFSPARPLPVLPGLVLELAYDSSGLFAATWRAGSWRAAEIGEA